MVTQASSPTLSARLRKHGLIAAVLSVLSIPGSFLTGLLAMYAIPVSPPVIWSVCTALALKGKLPGWRFSAWIMGLSTLGVGVTLFVQRITDIRGEGGILATELWAVPAVAVGALLALMIGSTILQERLSAKWYVLAPLVAAPAGLMVVFPPRSTYGCRRRRVLLADRGIDRAW